MSTFRREFLQGLLRTSAVVGLVGLAGCEGGGVISGEPKKHAGGGPLPEMKEDEVDETSPKSKSKAKTKGR